MRTPSFTLTFKITEINGKFSANLMDMNFIHNGKKLVNASNHTSRSLRLGDFHINLNAVTTCMKVFNAFQHGLKNGDDDRNGFRSMDWPSAVRLVSKKHLECMRKMVAGEGVAMNRTVEGMLVFLKMVRRYIGIFASRRDDLKTRVESAGYVCMFLRLWRQWIKHHPDMNLATHFISREAYQDTLLSCHYFAMLLMVLRECAPDHPVMPWRTGSDPCEHLFSQLGSFNINKRVFAILASGQSIHSMNVIRFLISSGELDLPTLNKRLDQSWDEDEEEDVIPDLKKWLPDVELVKDWVKGSKKAREELRKLGLQPDKVNGVFPTWWSEPWKKDGMKRPASAPGDGIEDDVPDLADDDSSDDD